MGELKCDKCDKTFKTQHSLDRHMRSHLGIKTSSCTVCGKTFVDSTRLKQHMWIHAGYKAFKCEICEKEFRHKSHLKSHISSFHPELKEKEGENYQCNLCEKSFPYQYKLNYHMTWHAAQEVSGIVKPKIEKSTFFLCSICQEQFESLDDLTAHARIHPAQKNEAVETGTPIHNEVILVNNVGNVSEVGHKMFELPENINVGDTVHVDEQGRVQIVQDYHQGYYENVSQEQPNLA